MSRILIAALAPLAALAMASACGDGASPAPDGGGPGAGLTVSDDGAGGVTVEATWVTPAHLAGSEDLQRVASAYEGRNVTLIHVRLDTHSVDLARYDLGELASLDVGNGPEPALGYEALSEGSHHREGVLAFGMAPPSEGPATLVVRDVAGVPDRRLVWDRVPRD